MKYSNANLLHFFFFFFLHDGKIPARNAMNIWQTPFLRLSNIMWKEQNIFLRLNNGTICSVTPQTCNVILFSFFFLLFRLIYFKCCFNK